MYFSSLKKKRSLKSGISFPWPRSYTCKKSDSFRIHEIIERKGSYCVVGQTKLILPFWSRRLRYSYGKTELLTSIICECSIVATELMIESTHGLHIVVLIYSEPIELLLRISRCSWFESKFSLLGALVPRIVGLMAAPFPSTFLCANASLWSWFSPLKSPSSIGLVGCS